MNISEAAARSGLTADAIRFYEREGVLPQPPRAPNGYRRYTEQHINALRLARRLRELDLDLHEVGAVIDVAHSATCGDLRDELRASLAQALDQTDARISELRETRGEVSALLDALDVMRPMDETLPGLAACECVALTTAT